VSLCVEPATEFDIADWLILAAEVGDLFGADMANDPTFRARLRRNVGEGAAFCVRVDGAMAGAMLFKAGTIGWLAVSKRSRRCGVARALVAHAQSAARDIRVTTFGAGHPHPDSQASRSFYRVMGFRTVTGGGSLGPDATPREALIWRAPESERAP
jgi:GNAT superfamily N-acetyltransferase